jgi:hypothetical protein
MSSVNPAGIGGAAEQFAEVLLLNNDIRTLVDEGFQNMESDRFERNFRRLLKDYASSLRIEAKDTLEKGATKIVHTYRAYVTRIIRSKVVGPESEFQALAFHEIKSQETSKVTLERFLEQYQAPKEDKRLEESRENLESEAGSKFSDDEQPYLPNLEKVTDFLVSSTAFEAFKEALCAFVRPRVGPLTSAAQLESGLNYDINSTTRMDVDVPTTPKVSQIPNEAPKKHILELDDSIQPSSKRPKTEQMGNEIHVGDHNSNKKRQPSLEGYTQVEADVEMLDTEGDCSLLPYSATPISISNQETAEKIGESNHRVGPDQNSEYSPELSEHSNRVMPSQSPTVGLPPRFSIRSSEYGLGSDASQMRNQGLKNDQRSHERRHSQADIEPVSAARHSISDEGPPFVFQEQTDVQRLKLNIQSRVKNTIKKLLRPPISADFERIEWICVSLSQVTFETNL